MHSYLLLVSSSKGSFGEESLEIGSLRCIVVIWEEERGRERKAYQRYMAEGITQGSRRNSIPRVRSEITERLVKELGMSLAEVARLLGVSTSAISKILQRIVHGEQ